MNSLDSPAGSNSPKLTPKIISLNDVQKGLKNFPNTSKFYSPNKLQFNFLPSNSKNNSPPKQAVAFAENSHPKNILIGRIRFVSEKISLGNVPPFYLPSDSFWFEDVFSLLEKNFKPQIKAQSNILDNPLLGNTDANSFFTPEKNFSFNGNLIRLHFNSIHNIPKDLTESADFSNTSLQSYLSLINSNLVLSDSEKLYNSSQKNQFPKEAINELLDKIPCDYDKDIFILLESWDYFEPPNNMVGKSKLSWSFIEIKDLPIILPYEFQHTLFYRYFSKTPITSPFLNSISKPYYNKSSQESSQAILKSFDFHTIESWYINNLSFRININSSLENDFRTSELYHEHQITFKYLSDSFFSHAISKISASENFISQTNSPISSLFNIFGTVVSLSPIYNIEEPLYSSKNSKSLDKPKKFPYFILEINEYSPEETYSADNESPNKIFILFLGHHYTKLRGSIVIGHPILATNVTKTSFDLSNNIKSKNSTFQTIYPNSQINDNSQILNSVSQNFEYIQTHLVFLQCHFNSLSEIVYFFENQSDPSIYSSTYPYRKVVLIDDASITFYKLLNYNSNIILYYESRNVPSSILSNAVGKSTNSPNNYSSQANLFTPSKNQNNTNLNEITSSSINSSFSSNDTLNCYNNQNELKLIQNTSKDNQLIFFTGRVTKIIDSKIGFYLIDDYIYLLIGLCESFNPWIPIRERSTIRVNNVSVYTWYLPDSSNDFQPQFIYSWEILSRFRNEIENSFILLGGDKTTVDVLGQINEQTNSPIPFNLPSNKVTSSIFNLFKSYKICDQRILFLALEIKSVKSPTSPNNFKDVDPYIYVYIVPISPSSENAANVELGDLELNKSTNNISFMAYSSEFIPQDKITPNSLVQGKLSDLKKTLIIKSATFKFEHYQKNVAYLAKLHKKNIKVIPKTNTSLIQILDASGLVMIDKVYKVDNRLEPDLKHNGLSLLLDSDSFLKHSFSVNSSSSFLKYSNIDSSILSTVSKSFYIDSNNGSTFEDVLISFKKFFEQDKIQSKNNINQVDSICFGYKLNDIVSISGVLERITLFNETISNYSQLSFTTSKKDSSLNSNFDEDSVKLTISSELDPTYTANIYIDFFLIKNFMGLINGSVISLENVTIKSSATSNKKIYFSASALTKVSIVRYPKSLGLFSYTSKNELLKMLKYQKIAMPNLRKTHKISQQEFDSAFALSTSKLDYFSIFSNHLDIISPQIPKNSIPETKLLAQIDNIHLIELEFSCPKCFNLLFSLECICFIDESYTDNHTLDCGNLSKDTLADYFSINFPIIKAFVKSNLSAVVGAVRLSSSIYGFENVSKLLLFDANKWEMIISYVIESKMFSKLIYHPATKTLRLTSSSDPSLEYIVNQLFLQSSQPKSNIDFILINILNCLINTTENYTLHQSRFLLTLSAPIFLQEQNTSLSILSEYWKALRIFISEDVSIVTSFGKGFLKSRKKSPASVGNAMRGCENNDSDYDVNNSGFSEILIMYLSFLKKIYNDIPLYVDISKVDRIDHVTLSRLILNFKHPYK
ncbi:hypothetical protein AYI69_g3079 [Smittium culicis]|uniref:Uncharacterized protein n=1 Tax=Smittium culicis TaxID=133412 RepID=A0A1R1YKQ7_9FUNG|nr:hypothetical protein AYI69_g3079 [Smittium culicis]